MHQCLPLHVVSWLELIGISIIGNRRFFDNFLRENMLKHVCELVLRDCRMSRGQMASIIAACNNLTLVHLANMDCLFTPSPGYYRYRGGLKPQGFTDEELVIMGPSLQSMRCLKLENFRDLSDPIFHRLTDLMPDLESLHLINVSVKHSTGVSKYFTFSGLARFIILRAPRMKELYLDSIALQPGSIAVLLRTQQLKLKNLGLRLDTDPFFYAIRLQPDMERVELCVSRAIDSRTMLPFVERLTQLHLEQCQINSTFTGMLGQLARLTSLRLVNVQVTDIHGTAGPFALITNMATGLPQLQHLSLVNVGVGGVDDLMAICCDLRHLTTLELQGCPHLTTEAFVCMLSLQAHLRCFTLHSCTISNDPHSHGCSTRDIRIIMPRLHKLHLVDCQLTDDVYMKFDHLPALRSFHVACHPKSDGSGLCYFAKNATSLEVIRVNQMSRISDTYRRQKTLSIMLSCLPRLRDVGLLLFGAISDDLLKWLLDCCPNLHTLDIRGCTCNKIMINTVLKMKLADIKLT